MVNNKDKCQNPFFSCTSPNPTNIALDIIFKGERLSICQDCWTKIADSEITWGTLHDDTYLRAKDLRLWTSN